MRKLLFAAVAFLFSVTGVKAQANAPLDVKVEGIIIDMKYKTALNNELIVFKSSKNTNEYQVLSNEKGKFSTRLPRGDVYRMFVMGFKDSTSKDNLEIPPYNPKENYNTYNVTLEFEPAKTFTLDNVEFEYKKSDLRPESFKALDELVEFLQARPTERIEIGGHTDNIGGDAYNQKLSEARAKSVVDYLISKGIDANRLAYKGYGADEPVEDNSTEAGRQKNRRTEVKVLD
jgi:OmpA-OmpF porin, OOP family